MQRDEYAFHDEPESNIRVVAICGSLRADSYTRKALTLVLDGAGEVGAKVELVDLRDYELVFCRGRELESDLPEDVVKLRKTIQSAQGIILGTPDYHGSLSGVLKNALDLMGFDEFAGKMLGLVGVSDNSMGAVHALSTLRTIGRSLHSWVLPNEVSISGATQVFDHNKHLHDEKLKERLHDLGREVARFAFLRFSNQAEKFISAWESALTNPGGRRAL